MKKAVIFDVDGTLLNTERLYMQGWREGGALLGYTVTDEALMRTRAVNVDVAKQVFRECCGEDFPYDKVRVERVRISEALIAAASPETLRMPQAKEAVLWLKKKGLPVAVASSTGYEHTEAHLRHAELWELFDAVVTGDQLPKGRGKPNPDIFLMAAEKLGVKPEDCIVVGDTPADVNAGFAAGMTVILIPDQVPANDETRARSRKVLDNIGQLPAVLEEII